MIGIIEHREGLSAYLEEILVTWGVRSIRMIDGRALAGVTSAEVPVMVCPSGVGVEIQVELKLYVEGGGRLIVFEPQGLLAEAAGVKAPREWARPLRLRVSGMHGSGLAGEALPVVGRARWFEQPAFDDARVLAQLYDPARIDGVRAECAGIVESQCGAGRMIAVAFDLAYSVMLLRQGDPGKAERRLWDGPGHAQTPKPSDMAVDIGPRDCGWIPFADLESRLLVDLVERLLPAPLPVVGHLPGDAASVILYSGDEDNAPLTATAQQLETLTERGVRMSLYIIPDKTQSGLADGERYAARHDIGPHPNLVPLRSAPVAERVAAYEGHLREFNRKFQTQGRTGVNHAASWAGYLDLVHVQARNGMRMDLNYSSGHFQREREHAPYSPFGASMPMRFCEPGGTMIDVFQQHRHYGDDLMFARGRGYSFCYTLEVFARMLRRVIDDAAERFHTPLAFNFHPGNWVTFAEPFGMEVVDQAQRRKLPIWSFEQWLDFRDAAEGRVFSNMRWDGTLLAFDVEVGQASQDVRVWLPALYLGRKLKEVTHDGERVKAPVVTRYDRPVVLLPAKAGEVRAVYETSETGHPRN
jgi:hypothetical protein